MRGGRGRGGGALLKLLPNGHGLHRHDVCVPRVKAVRTPPPASSVRFSLPSSSLPSVFFFFSRLLLLALSFLSISLIICPVQLFRLLSLGFHFPRVCLFLYAGVGISPWDLIRPHLH